jgi:hypothetical protein
LISTKWVVVGSRLGTSHVVIVASKRRSIRYGVAAAKRLVGTTGGIVTHVTTRPAKGAAVIVLVEGCCFCCSSTTTSTTGWSFMSKFAVVTVSASTLSPKGTRSSARIAVIVEAPLLLLLLAATTKGRWCRHSLPASATKRIIR